MAERDKTTDEQLIERAWEMYAQKYWVEREAGTNVIEFAAAFAQSILAEARAQAFREAAEIARGFNKGGLIAAAIEQKLEGISRICRICGEAHDPERSYASYGHEFEPPDVPAGVGQVRPIDGKFGVKDGKIVNLVSGQEIPTDEPLFLLRARDHHAIATLSKYLDFARFDCNELHLAGVQQVLARFQRFREKHPELMKQPGITRHLKLDSDGKLKP